MSLRTYPLIVHPAFISFVEAELGRDKGLHDLPASITPTHFPSLESAYDIAEYLKVSPFLFRGMLQSPRKHYRSFSFQKRSGGKRVIHSPRTFLKVVQWWILDTILSNVQVSDLAHGFVPGRSFVTNARVHFGATHILNLDIKDFFPSVRDELVVKVFQDIGYSDKVSKELVTLTTLDGSLPQGAPTSPMLANIILGEVDERLNDLATRHDLIFTRYADDLTFSGKMRIPDSVVNEVSTAIGALGLVLNNTKARFMGPNDQKEVTGLVLGQNDIRLGRQFLNAARGWFYKASQNPADFTSQEERIRGTVALIEHVKGAGSAKVAELGNRALLRIKLHRSTATSSTNPSDIS